MSGEAELGAHQAADVGPGGQADDQRDREQVAPVEGRQQQEDEEDRDREHEVHAAHHEVVPPAAAPAREGAEARADGDGHQRREEAHRERDAAAVQAAHEVVAPELGRPEGMLERGRLLASRQVQREALLLADEERPRRAGRRAG